MSVDLFTPAGLLQPAPYHHASIATGTRQVHIAGQIARDSEGNRIATGDLSGQVAQALRNIHRALVGSGANFRDVVRLRFYVTHWHPDKIQAFMAGVASVADELDLPQPLPPSSLIGVDYLFEPDVLVEVEATAVLA